MRLFAVYVTIILSMGLLEATAFFGGDRPSFWQVLDGDESLAKPQLFTEDIDDVREEHIYDWWAGALHNPELLRVAEEEGITAIMYSFKKSDGIDRVAVRYLDIRSASQDMPELHSSWSRIYFIFNDSETATVAVNKGNGLVTTYDYKQLPKERSIIVGLLVSDEEQRE